MHIDHKLHLFDWGEAITLGELDALNDREVCREVGVAGTPFFMAPEALNYLTGRADQNADALRSTLTTKLDVWGLGTVIYFLLAGRDIFATDSSYELDNLADIVNASTGVELPEDVSASYAARDFLARCLERDADQRASAKELLQHPWFAGATTYEEVQAAKTAAAVHRGGTVVAVMADYSDSLEDGLPECTPTSPTTTSSSCNNSPTNSPTSSSGSIDRHKQQDEFGGNAVDCKLGELEKGHEQAVSSQCRRSSFGCEAVCEIRLKPSGSAASLGSVSYAPVTASCANGAMSQLQS